MTKGVSRHPLRHRATPHEVFRAVCGESADALWLDHHGERGSGVSFIAQGTPVTLTPHWRAEVRAAWQKLALGSSGDLEGIPLGVHLVLPYELAGETLGVPTHEEAIPRALVVTQLMAISHDTGEVVAYSLGPKDELTEWADSIDQALEASAPLPLRSLTTLGTVSWRDSEERYLEMIRRAQDFIAQGDAYQLCVTTSLTLQGEVDPVELHRVMRESNPTHHQALIRLADATIVSASPETFVSLSREGVVGTRPIKGTRPRGSTPTEDKALARELLQSDKERAENLMIVDLMRNDLSRVCETGTVRAPELLVVESYATVHQLVSTITGQVREGLDVVDLLEATFPAGSMTGAPKKRAVEILQQLEGHPRSLYSGAYGVWRADGSAEFAMTIRTAVVGPDSLAIGVGGGITALSEPSEEIREVGIKAKAFLRALGAEQVGYS
ncbi:MAG: anthranilate synthase component I family protein [Pontimonas sp.]|nr:anthranilate synthase component I family protein [Pontimonas sp.]